MYLTVNIGHSLTGFTGFLSLASLSVSVIYGLLFFSLVLCFITSGLVYVCLAMSLTDT